MSKDSSHPDNADASKPPEKEPEFIVDTENHQCTLREW